MTVKAARRVAKVVHLVLVALYFLVMVPFLVLAFTASAPTAFYTGIFLAQLTASCALGAAAAVFCGKGRAPGVAHQVGVVLAVDQMLQIVIAQGRQLIDR